MQICRLQVCDRAADRDRDLGKDWRKLIFERRVFGPIGDQGLHANIANTSNGWANAGGHLLNERQCRTAAGQNHPDFISSGRNRAHANLIERGAKQLRQRRDKGDELLVS